MCSLTGCPSENSCASFCFHDTQINVLSVLKRMFVVLRPYCNSSLSYQMKNILPLGQKLVSDIIAETLRKDICLHMDFIPFHPTLDRSVAIVNWQTAVPTANCVLELFISFSFYSKSLWALCFKNCFRCTLNMLKVQGAVQAAVYRNWFLNNVLQNMAQWYIPSASLLLKMFPKWWCSMCMLMHAYLKSWILGLTS